MRPSDLLAWVMAITASILIVVFSLFVIVDWYNSNFTRWSNAMMFDQSSPPILVAAVAVFIAAGISTFITRYFRSSRGDLEFSALGIKFKGPAGPILLWVVSFLAVAAVILLLMRSNTSR